ncbi:MAG: lipopolysaccharide kinase InaA family protein [Planctomycetaceae bacterium]|nr:lipopolysaccharide kinase InaA family protein [Planctomycetaceae bacterium]
MIACETCDASVLDALRAQGLDSVQGAFAWQGGSDLNKPLLGHRRRTRLELACGDERLVTLYLKRYGPESLWHAAKRVLRGRPCAGMSEAANIAAARSASVPTMQALAWGQEKGLLPRRSYIVVTAVPGDAMERCFDDFLARSSPEMIEAVTVELASVVGRLHGAGYVHRDLYAAHVFLHEGDGGCDLYLIDLARMFRPASWRMRRWIVKDLGQLKYSMPPAWAGRWWPVFMEHYALGRSAAERAALDAAVEAKAAGIARQQQRRHERKARQKNA